MTARPEHAAHRHRYRSGWRRRRLRNRVLCTSFLILIVTLAGLRLLSYLARPHAVTAPAFEEVFVVEVPGGDRFRAVRNAGDTISCVLYCLDVPGAGEPFGRAAHEHLSSLILRTHIAILPVGSSEIEGGGIAA